MYLLLVFFFKQKTAYEMRISDWSSDVCSSDLRRPLRGRRSVAPRLVLPAARRGPARGGEPRGEGGARLARHPRRHHPRQDRYPGARRRRAPQPRLHQCLAEARHRPLPLRPDAEGRRHRSEEHTSELQSLMRISYAVFCLKKKTKRTSTINT